MPGVEIVGRTETGRPILSPILETGGGYAEYAVALAGGVGSLAAQLAKLFGPGW